MWPAYFDSTRSRSGGRRVPKNLAVTIPRVAEVKEAIEKAGLKCELVPEAGYSKIPWIKAGMVLVEKKGSKTQTIMVIGRKLFEMRSVLKVEGN